MRVLCEEIHLRCSLPAVFGALLSRTQPVFLDSSLVHRHLGRYSYISADPFLSITCQDGRLEIYSMRDGVLSSEVTADPLAVIQALLCPLRTERLPNLPPFQGGAAGYFAYDLGRSLEKLPNIAADDLHLPDLALGIYDWVLACDHLQGRSWLIVNDVAGKPLEARRRLRELATMLQSIDSMGSPAPIRATNWPSGNVSHASSVSVAKLDSCPAASVKRSQPFAALRPASRAASLLRSNFTRDGYLGVIGRAKDHIAAGDIYEICLSQRLAMPLFADSWPLYCRMRSISPVPYGAYLRFPGFAIASGSPELFLRLEGSCVETRPIKGTRPRARAADEDARLAAELLASEKERAENVMIVDLLRNDLGRVCQTGSVRVPKLFDVEHYSTVHQMVSTIEGVLRPGLDGIDLLRACFPGGSVTGCPKIRAMEIIDALEPTRRGAYCGAIGFLAFDGEMDTSITIRTIVVKDGGAYCQVGGAIVADSEPEAEYQETLDKARAALLALGGVDTRVPSMLERIRA